MPDKPTSEEAYSALNRVLEESRTDISDISDAIEELGSSPGPEDIGKRIPLLAKKVIDIDSRLVEAFDFAAALYGHATTDGLTGFRTKAYFDTVVKPRLAQHPNLAYLMVDIDQFKRYNDSYGHPQGDEAIRSVTGVIQRVAPTDLLFRFGGEEFSVIVVGYDVERETAYKIAENIREEVQKNVIQVMAARSVAEDLTTRISEEYGMMMNKEFRVILEAFGATKHTSSTSHEEVLQALIGSARSEMANQENLMQKQTTILDEIHQYLYRLQRLTVSIGGAVKDTEEPIDNLIKRADDALYVAKKTRIASSLSNGTFLA
ncbi:MAG: GGDEF domain-containing protein [Nanoarchaeota archaeon]|nr:GGDEF domain-containing protein [Nanoarchaeota archaeon]